MTDLPLVIAFCAVAVVLLALVSYMLYRRAVELGHQSGAAGGRLVVFWLGCLGALAVGLYFHHLYPQGLFNVNFSGGEQPLVLTGAQAKAPLFLAIAGMIVCALVAWLAVRPLHNRPPDGAPEGKPE